MSEVKRYDPEVYVHQGLGRPGIMSENIDGCYVDYDAYESVKAKADALINLWESIYVNVPHFGANLEEAIAEWSEKNRYLHDTLSSEWCSSEEEHQLREMGFIK